MSFVFAAGMVAPAPVETGAAGGHREPVETGDDDPAALVRQVQRGSRAAFAILYDRFHRVVHAVALARVPAADAGDIVQDVFTEAWLEIGSLRDAAAFPGWLLAMARNRAVDHARGDFRRQRSLAAERDTAPEPAIAPPPRAEAAAALAAIRELAETYRETLIMRLVEGLSGPEIAVRTGMTPDSVRVNLHRGMMLLRRRLGGQGDET